MSWEIARNMLRVGDQVLVVDPEGIEDFEYKTPREVFPVDPPTVPGTIERRMGKSSLILNIKFKDGYHPYWEASNE